MAAEAWPRFALSACFLLSIRSIIILAINYSLSGEKTQLTEYQPAFFVCPATEQNTHKLIVLHVHEITGLLMTTEGGGHREQKNDVRSTAFVNLF